MFRVLCFVLDCLSLYLLDFSYFFFFNDTATTEIYTLSLHDALPIFCVGLEAAPAASPSAASRSSPPASMKYLTACSKLHRPVCRFTSTPIRAARYRDRRRICPCAGELFG